MTIENRLILEKFIEEFGPTERPDPTKMGNFGCCDDCKRKCEKLAANQMNERAVNDYIYLERRMGVEAYKWGLPLLVAEFLAEPTREGFANLESEAFSWFDDLSEKRQQAIDTLMGFLRASAELGYFPSEFDDIEED